MAETLRKRRRWPWIALVAACWPVAWSFDPLSSAERKLLGIWEIASVPAPNFGIEREQLELTADRRFLRRNFLENGGRFNRDGDWRVYGETLFLIERPKIRESLRDRYRGRSAAPLTRSYQILDTNPATRLGTSPPPWQKVSAER